jgi:transposase
MAEIEMIVPLLFVGIDWDSREHRVAVLDAAGKQVRDWTVEHTGAELVDLVERLAALVQGAVTRCQVGIELKSGPIVEMLIERGFTVFAVNPKQTDRFRDRYMPSGAKDDRRDALVLASAVRTDSEHLTRLSKTDSRTIELRAMLRLRDELVGDKARLLMRLREQLWRYYAQMIELADGEFDARWLWKLWEKAPTPREGAALSKSVVSRLLRDHHVRRIDADGVMTILRKPSLVVADGVEKAGSIHVRSIIERLRLLDEQARAATRDIEQQLTLWSKLASSESEPSAASARADPPGDEAPSRCEQRDEMILRSLPGVGTITLATLLAEAAEPLEKRDYTALRTMFGVAPITRQSGNSRVVVMRRACSETLRNAAFNWARAAVANDARCRERFRAHVARGARKPAAYRSVVDHLLRVACSMLRAGTEYDPAHLAQRRAA